MDQGHIIFRVLHHENISITMDAGVSLFFGLHGQYTISTAQESYTVGASEVYAVSPFTLYRAVSGENQACCRSRAFARNSAKRLTGRRGK